MPGTTISGPPPSLDAELLEARAALGAAIAGGAYRSVFDVVFGWIRARVHAALRVRISAPAAALVVGALMVAMSGLVAVASGRGSSFLGDLPRHAGIIGIGMTGALACVTLTHKLLDVVRETILGALERTEDFASVRAGLASIFDVRRQVRFAVLLAPMLSAPLVYALHLRGEPIERIPEVACSIFTNSLLVGAALYYPFKAFPFLARMGRFHFRLYRAAPSNSEVIDALSDASISTLNILSAVF